jgi:hypothetical protein
LQALSNAEQVKSNSYFESNKKREIIMTTLTRTPLTNRNSLLRSIAIGGMFIFIIQSIHMWIVPVLIQKNPFIAAWQYIASGALGMAAFEGGNTTALLGVIFHLIISFVIAGVFILSAERIPLLRRNLIVGSLLYGFGVFIVMHMIVTPLSATPPLPAPTLPWLFEAIIEHTLLVGLALGIIVQWNVKNIAP